MKTTIQKYKHKRILTEVEVTIPEETKYYWHNGIRRAYSVKPVWTTWNLESCQKPEEIWQLLVVEVDPHYQRIEAHQVPISQLGELIQNEKHPLNRLISGFLSLSNEDTRTIEEFGADFTRTLEKIYQSTEVLWQ